MTLGFLAVIAVLLLWLIFKPDWLPRLPEKEVKETVEKQAEIVREKTTGWVQNSKTLLLRKTKYGLLLKNWILQEDLVETYQISEKTKDYLSDLQLWIKELEDQEADAIAAEMEEFCNRKGIQLEWLLDARTSTEVSPTFAELVLHFCMAVRERMEYLPHAALRSWEAAPDTRENRAFGQQLFQLMANAQIIDFPSNLLFASDKDKYAYIVDALKNAISIDREQVSYYSVKAFEATSAIKPAAGKTGLKAVEK